ncbi:MAG: glycosyltransferase family 4 protein [Bacteroidota bacterium]
MNPSLNIAELTDHHIDSGIGYYSYELTKALQKHTSATLFKPYRSNHIDSTFHSKSWIKGVSYRSFRQFRPYVLPLYLRAGLSTSSYDVVHAHWYLAGLAATYLSKTPVVVTMHDVSVLHTATATNKYIGYYRWALNRFKSQRIPLITVSEQARQDTIRYAEYPEELVFAVHNGLNTDRFYPMKRKSNSRFTIVYSGGLAEHKNLELLLNALRIVQESHPDVALKIAGGSPQNTPYPALVKSLRLQNISFTGFVPDPGMNDFYNSGDLMVYTSRYEGFGMAPLEAMSCGVPVISTNGGALQEVSGGGAVMCGYDAEELATEIINLIDHPSKHAAVAKRGHEWIKQYTWDNAAINTLNIYNSLI